MSTEHIQPFQVIGIAVRTTNENNQAARDIGPLWNRFFSEGIIDQIPGKIDPTIYCIYTDYEKDHTRPYTTVIGCSVESLDNIPEGMTGVTITGGNYTKHVARGNILQGLLYEAWTFIWNAGWKRKYTADFERYDEKAQNPEDAEVAIFIATEY